MSKKIAFMGTPNISGQILKSLYQNGFNIEIVYTQPPVSSNRGHKLNKSPVHIMAEILNIPVRTPVKLDNLEEKKFIKSKNIDLGIVVAYGQIIPKSILESCKLGFINIHASLLPKYRGAAPIQRSLINLEKFTGISFMKLNNVLDSGPIFNQYKIPINKTDNSETLSKKLSELSAEKITQNIELIFSNKATFVDQIHNEASYAEKINKIEGKINWNESALNILGKINGLFPNPGAWFEFKKERYKIIKSELSESTGKPGEVIDDLLTVACGKNSIRILEIQRQGKKVQNTSTFLLGSKIKKGVSLKRE